MNRTELLTELDKLISQSEEEKTFAKTHLDRMFLIGKVNGLLWAKNIIINNKEFIND